MQPTLTRSRTLDVRSVNQLISVGASLTYLMPRMSVGPVLTLLQTQGRAVKMARMRVAGVPLILLRMKLVTGGWVGTLLVQRLEETPTYIGSGRLT